MLESQESGPSLCLRSNLGTRTSSESLNFQTADKQKLLKAIKPEEPNDGLPGDMLADISSSFSQSTEEMILLPKRKYDQLTYAKEHDATIDDFQAVIAPITVGNSGHQAFNANVGLVQTPLHDGSTPGNIFYETQGAQQVRFEPHVTKLVKNDFLGVNPFQEYGELITSSFMMMRSEKGAPFYEYSGAMRPETGNRPSLASNDIYQGRNQVKTSQLKSPAQGSIGNSPYLIGTNLYSQESDTINFYEGYSSVHYKDHLRRLNFGPFAWSSLMKRDVGLRTVWDYVVSKKEKISNRGHSAALMFAQPTGEVSDENTETLFSIGKDSDQSEQQFQRRALQTDGVDDMMPYKTIIQARQNAHKQKALLNKHALPLGLTVYDGRLDRELQLIEKIEVVLPKKRVLWKLIHRFFQSMYTYMPFIDEDYFRQDLERIIGPQSFEDVSIAHIKIEKKLDLATVGILLIILRLAYLSLFSNNSSLNEFILNNAHPNKENMLVQYLMKNPININTIDVASLCLDQFQVLRRSNFTVLQLALFLRLYHTYAPEDGDGADGGDSQVLNSVLIQSAFSLGMNREPDEQYTDPKMNHLIRKIWIFLVASDLHLSYSFGNPITIGDMHYDINPPACDPGSENLRDKAKDWASTNRLNWCLKLSPKLRNILQCALNIKGRTALPKLCEDISEFELNLHSDIGSINDFIVCTGMDELEVANRNMKVKVYLALKSFLISIFFHLYLHYEEHDLDVSFFYLKKKPTNVEVVMDCDFDDLMSDKEIVSLSNQITRCYSAMRHSTHEVPLTITSFNKRLRERFENTLPDHSKWKNIKFEGDASLSDFISKKGYEPSKVTYLTADTENELEELTVGETYIIGGIVDKNRHKRLCLDKAKELGLKVARLPIGKFIKMNGRQVLATSHVYEIMCMWFEQQKDWEKAFNSVLPPRKLHNQNEATIEADSDAQGA
ncbi:uncharacterized protein CXQ87_004498 [Candidozyma duobushaemuli]|uniref:tRNA (guanine(9)-N1)-methyltransferase n=1 Tax=Candidozyma duobushaemuli TaxID=1231522 RepID=A0A2V1AFT7_9ASCO|nr:uncharacterized protein CXQ87_004498 [[Candida] duobushaemulonis]PVH16940.1 hypothetical protein CXQ87_004498 [[Candida] duobushaemulonis]